MSDISQLSHPPPLILIFQKRLELCVPTFLRVFRFDAIPQIAPEQVLSTLEYRLPTTSFDAFLRRDFIFSPTTSNKKMLCTSHNTMSMISIEHKALVIINNLVYTFIDTILMPHPENR